MGKGRTKKEDPSLNQKHKNPKTVTKGQLNWLEFCSISMWWSLSAQIGGWVGVQNEFKIKYH
jgi:hypothetical protein